MVSTHTPLARRDLLYFFIFASLSAVSTHTPLARRDCVGPGDGADERGFLLTRLLRGATVNVHSFIPSLSVSTHTPLARRDHRDESAPAGRSVSTHTPLARRDCIITAKKETWNTFLLTRLLRGATISGRAVSAAFIVSTHTPLARRDFTPLSYV